jgi:hypothetical protein
VSAADLASIAQAASVGLAVIAIALAIYAVAVLLPRRKDRR